MPSGPPLKTSNTKLKSLIFTAGHSTHPIERFLELLGEHRTATLADVRSFPSSRRWPHFNQAELEKSLARAGIEYRWLKRLGGQAPFNARRFPAHRMGASRVPLLRRLHRKRRFRGGTE